MKYRVKKGHRIHYPDGSIRGERGYIIDGSAYYERPTLEDHGDALEPVRDRQLEVDPVDVTRLWSAPDQTPEPAPKATKKKTAKKKAAKKAPKKIIDKILGNDDGGEA